MDKEDLIKELEEKEELIADLNNKLEEQKFIQSRNKEYIFTLEYELNKKNKQIKNLKKKNEKYKFKPVDNESKSKKSKIFDVFLNKSNSHVFYKNNYELLRNVHKYDEKLLKEKNSEIKIYRNENNFLKKDIKNKQKDINYLKELVDKKYYEINELEENLKRVNINLNRTGKELGEFKKPEIIKKLNNNEYSDLTISIKTPNPKDNHQWGDYFFALALKKSFQKKGFHVIIQEKEDWYSSNIKADINLVLRGKVEYHPNFDEINVMWNISHPDLVTKQEYEQYDICFISSEKYAEKLNNEVKTIVKPLLQCTDPDVFYTSKDEFLSENLLFVGRTRGEYRKIIKDVMETDFDVSVYGGGGWHRYIDEKYIKEEFIPNDELNKYYSSCNILLNDHWEEMRIWDFPSNRLFDALACGTFIISDEIESAHTVFEDTVITYNDADDLNDKIEYYLTHDEEREKISKKGQEIVLKNHTFDNRVETIIDCLRGINLNLL